jgi:hypothetical protein
VTDETIDDLERLLQEAKEAEEAAGDAAMRLFPARGPEWSAFLAAHEEVLQVERKLANARQEEHVIPVQFPVRWDVGAPLPYLLCNDYRTFLTFFLPIDDPDWDGTYVTIRSPDDDSPARIAVVEFHHCVASKLGDPNDEVHNGHPWDGKGLRAYSAQEVINSRWVAEIESINRVHSQYSPEKWKRLHHYVLWFHDSTFECIAESFTVELRNEDFASVLENICRRLVT